MVFIGFGGGKKRKAPKSILKHGGSIPKLGINAQPRFKANLLFKQHGIDPRKHSGAFSSIESIFREWQAMEQTGNYSKSKNLNAQLTRIFQAVLDKEAR